MKALHDWVVIEPLKEDLGAQTIVLPENMKTKGQRGKVVAVGPGLFKRDGTRAQMTVKVGDVVWFAKFVGHDLKVGGVDYHAVHESDVVVVLE